MNKNVYALRDQKVDVYLNPVYMINNAEAKRMLVATMMGNSDISKFPGDFGLYQLGTWDNETGVYTPLGAPELVMSGLAAAEQAKEIINNQEENQS